MKPEFLVELFTKWYTERTDVLCTSRLLGWDVNFMCSVSEAPSISVVTFSSDGTAGFILHLDTPGMEFRYTEPKDLDAISREERDKISPELRELSFVTVIFPLRLLVDDVERSRRDALFLAELPKGEIKRS
jgi:hypothetical protein